MSARAETPSLLALAAFAAVHTIMADDAMRLVRKFDRVGAGGTLDPDETRHVARALRGG